MKAVSVLLISFGFVLVVLGVGAGFFGSFSLTDMPRHPTTIDYVESCAIFMAPGIFILGIGAAIWPQEKKTRKRKA